MVVESPVNGLHVRQPVVGQSVVLELGPHVFIGVEFRRVGREELYLYSRVLCQEVAHRSCPVGGTPIPQNRDLSSQVAKQMSDEQHDFRGANTLVREE